MKSFVTIFRSKAFMFTLMIGLFLTSFLIIVAMLLGNQSGNFVIQVENGDVNKSISITDDEEDRVYTNMLTVEGMRGMSNTTPRAFLGGTKYQQQITTLKNHVKELEGGQVNQTSNDQDEQSRLLSLENFVSLVRTLATVQTREDALQLCMICLFL